MGAIKPLAKQMTSNLVIVSNRGACTLQETAQGIQAIPAVSGLVSGIQPVLNQEGGAWIAWGGRYAKAEEVSGLSVPMPEREPKYMFHEVLLSATEVQLFYDGFANGCLWPLCHNFLEKTVFQEEHWQAYQKVNEKYAHVVLKNTSAQDYIWVQDYHLALLPGYIRRHRPQARIALFWHIPFPPAELLATLPWARELLNGMLENELIGFHTPNYVRNFLQAAQELVGAEVDNGMGIIYWSGRKIQVIAAPIGINWREFEHLASSEAVVQKAQQIRQAVGGEYLLLGVDRLDYTKGIPERLEAVAWLLENYPQYRGKLSLLQIAVPSRINTKTYQSLKRQIEESVGRINGKFTENYHVPIKYLFKPLSKADLVAHYLAADMALVTPLKDGLNLVAKEYIAANYNGTGVLLLSPFAGSASQLKEVIQVNPYHPRDMAAQIVLGLELPAGEKTRRLNALNQIIREQDITWWWRRFKQHWVNEGCCAQVGLTDSVPEVL